MTTHIPVLINQVLEFLAPAKGKIIIDATLGAGGHAEAVLKMLSGQGTLYGIDADSRNLEIAKKRLSEFKNVHFIHDNFENIGLYGERGVDGILMDLGLSSFHTDEAERGFSFQENGPLDMRFDTRQSVTAAEIVNTYPLDQLLYIFRTLGQEKYAYRIAKEIVSYRQHRHFQTTSELADCVAAAVTQGGKYPYQRRNPATRIFQALRIAANREIEVLEKGLRNGLNILQPGGRMVVISYHSLEDRIVKNIFREEARESRIKILTKKPIEPDEKEVEENPRSRSAKLRAAEKF